MLAIRVAAGLLLVALTSAGLFGGVGELARPAGDSSPARPSASPAANGTDDGFRVGFLPLLEDAAANARVLVATGEARDRNLLRVRSQQEAMWGSLDAADAWLDANPAPDRFISAEAAYREGATAIRTAMDDAQAAFLRLDFARVARAIKTLERGEAAITSAIALITAPG